MNLRKMFNPRKYNKRKISFSSMLNSEYFFQDSGIIQMALKKPEIIDKDFRIKRVKSTLTRLRQPKIDDSLLKKQNEQNDSSFSDKEKDKKQIPIQLGKILDDNEQKFLHVSKKYNVLKDQNNKFLNYWHYIKNSSKNKKQNTKDYLHKKFFEKIEKHFVDLNSDQVQKMTSKLFKSNPLLMYKNSSDMFFHFLSELNEHKNDKKKLDYIMKKHSVFLEKLKEFIEYSKIKNDTSVDKIAKDIKLKNSDYLSNYHLKVKIEEQKLKDKQDKQNINDISDSLKMIKATKKSIKAIEENKNFFEDPKYLMNNSANDFNKTGFNNFKSNFIFRNFNQSAKNISNKMNSTASTGFNIVENEKNKQKQKRYRNSVIGNMQNSLSMEIKKGGRKSVVNNIERVEKGVYERIISSKLVKNNKNEIKNKRKIEKINLKKKLSQRESKSLEYIKNNRNKNEKLEKKFSKDINNLSSINFRKEIPINNNFVNNKRKKFLRCNSVMKISKNSFLLDDKNDIKLSRIFKDDFQKKISRNNKSMMLEKDREYQLTNLYNIAKGKKKINEEDEKNIIDYFKMAGKEINNKKLKSIDLITRAKFVVNRLNIDKNTAKVLQQNISHKLADNLKLVKNINKKVNSLDSDFIKNIIFFQAKDESEIL